jgi:hypothetical protein
MKGGTGHESVYGENAFIFQIPIVFTGALILIDLNSPKINSNLPLIGLVKLNPIFPI